MTWRTGRTVLRTVYENDQIMFLCTTPEEAARVVDLLNKAEVADNQLAAKDAAYVDLDLKQRDTQTELDCALSESVIAGKRAQELESQLKDYHAMLRCTKGHVHNGKYGDGCHACLLQRERELSDQLAAALEERHDAGCGNCFESPSIGAYAKPCKAVAVLAQYAEARGAGNQ